MEVKVQLINAYRQSIVKRKVMVEFVSNRNKNHNQMIIYSTIKTKFFPWKGELHYIINREVSTTIKEGTKKVMYHFLWEMIPMELKQWNLERTKCIYLMENESPSVMKIEVWKTMSASVSI